MSQSRVWLVTGASSGFGRSMVERVLESGERVVATLRTPSALDDLASKFPKTQLLVLRCDVSVPSEIKSAFAKTKEAFGRCDVVFNNAAFVALCEVEGTPDEIARKVFEVDFWGATLVSTEAVKFFREVNPPGVGGRLLNISSIGGSTAAPGLGFYCASKFALEGITESLASELNPAWNIKVTLVKPGAFKTKAPAENLHQFPPPDAYREPASLGALQTRGLLESVAYGDPIKAVQKMYELADLDNPPLYFLLGKDAIEMIRTKLDSLSNAVKEYESWSDSLFADQ